jgi:hypothetical protein
MKTEHDEALAKALATLLGIVPGEDRAATESSLSPDSGDVGELFLAELQVRRERLKHWIRLVNEAAGANGGCAPAVSGPRHKCRGARIASPPRRRLGTAA